MDTVKQLKEEIARLKKEKKVVVCGYCGEELYIYSSDSPDEEEYKEAINIFHKHDYQCPKNPLVQNIQALQKTLQVFVEKMPYEDILKCCQEIKNNPKMLKKDMKSCLDVLLECEELSQLIEKNINKNEKEKEKENN